MRWEDAAGRLCLTLDVSEVGAVRVFAGRDWFWLLTPRRALRPFTDPECAAAMIAAAIGAARARQARTPDGHWRGAR